MAKKKIDPLNRKHTAPFLLRLQSPTFRQR